MPPVADMPTPSHPTTLRSLIVDRYQAAGFPSLRALGIAYAKAKGVSSATGVRDIRRYTGTAQDGKRRISERTALVLANVLGLEPLEFEPFLTRRAGGDADRMDDLERRIDRLEDLLEAILRELRDQRGDAPPGQSGSA